MEYSFEEEWNKHGSERRSKEFQIDGSDVKTHAEFLKENEAETNLRDFINKKYTKTTKDS